MGWRRMGRNASLRRAVASHWRLGFRCWSARDCSSRKHAGVAGAPGVGGNQKSPAAARRRGRWQGAPARNSALKSGLAAGTNITPVLAS